MNLVIEKKRRMAETQRRGAKSARADSRRILTGNAQTGEVEVGVTARTVPIIVHIGR